MAHFNKLVVFFLLFPFFTNAQSNYKPGYVVTLKGDTLHGYIDDRDWDTNPVKINFRKTVTDNTSQKFTTKDIGFFTVGGLSFEKYIGLISTDITDVNKMSEGRDTSYRSDTVFLQILQKEKNVALYSYSDDIKTRFYISERPDYVPTELVYRIYYGNDNASGDGRRTVNENTYLKQLFALANKYNVMDSDLENRIRKAGYLKDDLMSIVSKINSVSKADYENKYASHVKADFYIGAGLNIYSASPKPWASSYEYPSSTSTLPVFLIGINLIPKPKSDKIEFRAEFSVADYKYDSVNLWAISFVPQGIYNFYHTEDLKIYLGLGLLLTYNIYNNPGSVNGANNSFMFKAGIKFHNKVEIFANTLTFSGSQFDSYSALKSFNEQFGVIYHFN